MNNKKLVEDEIDNSSLSATLLKKEVEFWIAEAKNAKDQYQAKEAALLSDEFLFKLELSVSYIRFLEEVVVLA